MQEKQVQAQEYFQQIIEAFKITGDMIAVEEVERMKNLLIETK